MSREPRPPRVVGLAGSAGSQRVICDVFDRLPPDLGHAYVVITHRRDDQGDPSALLHTHTDMPIVVVTTRCRPEPNVVYMVGGGSVLRMEGGLLKCEPRRPTGPPSEIDEFFQSLAESEGRRAVGILCSGMLDDGARGLRHIASRSGVTIVQDPATAEFPSMPRSAIGLGTPIDFVLGVDEMASHLEESTLEARTQLDRSPTPNPVDDLIRTFGNLRCFAAEQLTRSILLLDADLRIAGFAGPIGDLLPVINTDLGRPVGDLVLGLDYGEFYADSERVVAEQVTRERIASTRDGTSYLVRISPGTPAPIPEIRVVVSFIPLDVEHRVGAAGCSSSGFREVAPYGVVLGHVTRELKYSWIFNPHPDFEASGTIGKRDDELAQNDGIAALVELKQRVLDTKRNETQMISFPLSRGHLVYRIAAAPIYDSCAMVTGVATIGLELAPRQTS